MIFHFILVEPKVPENVGASARALKTMGFGSLRLVRPCDFRDENALRLAHGARDLLLEAAIFDDLGSAVKDLDFVVGTTAKRRDVKRDCYTPEELYCLLKNKGSSIAGVGLVFGREDRGLSGEELSHCDIMTSVPMADRYPSLNLSQAVMIYAYALSGLVNGASQPSPEHVCQSQYTALKENVTAVLRELEMDETPPLFNRILERLGALGQGDIHLMHSVARRVMRRLKSQTTDR